MISWTPLTQMGQLEEIWSKSHHTPCIILKHSTRCSISAMAKMRLEADWDFDPDSCMAYYLDLLNYRDISNAIAERTGVYHESPQLLLIRNGACTYEASHLDITVSELKSCFMDKV